MVTPDFFHFKETPGEFTRVTFPSVYYYATSAWKIITKHRWRTVCFILSANYEGNTFADEMIRFAFQEKWEILKTVWLMDEAIGNTTETELKDAIRHGSDVIVMHSRLGYEAQFFEVIQKIGVSRHRTVWIVTDITTHLTTTNSQNLPEGLLKISLKTPEQCHDHSIYGNALQDAMLFFQLSFEESVRDSRDKTDVNSCGQIIDSRNFRQTAKRYIT